MGDFLNGWRRKVGVLSLVMALVFMAGWARSRDCAVQTSDEFAFHKSRRTHWSSASRSKGDGDALEGLDFYLEGKTASTYLILPYSVIAIPLTMISVFLLIGRPEKSIPKKTACTAPKNMA